MPISYKQVEEALFTLYGLHTSQIGALRGRLKNLQKLGINPSSPGKGQRIDYEISDAWRWALSLQLSSCGVEPSNLSAVLAQGEAIASGARAGEIWVLRRAVMSNWVFEPASANDDASVGWSRTQVFVGALYADLASRLSAKVKLAA